MSASAVDEHRGVVIDLATERARRRLPRPRMVAATTRRRPRIAKYVTVAGRMTAAAGALIFLPVAVVQFFAGVRLVELAMALFVAAAIAIAAGVTGVYRQDLRASAPPS